MTGLTWDRILRMRRTPSVSTRSLVATSWAAAQRLAERDGVLRGNHATVAGQYLELAGGVAVQAIALVPKSRESDFWRSVVSILESIVTEEREAPVAPVIPLVRRGP